MKIEERGGCRTLCREKMKSRTEDEKGRHLPMTTRLVEKLEGKSEISIIHIMIDEYNRLDWAQPRSKFPIFFPWVVCCLLCSGALVCSMDCRSSSSFPCTVWNWFQNEHIIIRLLNHYYYYYHYYYYCCCCCYYYYYHYYY